MGYQTIIFRRVELYEQVWTEPVRSVAKRYGISDVALAKHCKKLSVPVPGRGYWAEREAGKSPVRPALPKLAEGTRTEVRVERHRPDAGPLVNAEVIARIDQEKASAPIVVTSVLDDLHPLVAHAAKLLGKATPKNGLISVRGQPCLDVLVAPGSLDRALRILDALIKALMAREIPVEVSAVQVKAERTYGRSETPPPRYVTRALVNGEMIEWGLAEGWRTEMGPQPTPPKTLPRAQHESWRSWHRPKPVRVPDGVLALQISGSNRLGTRRTWKDGKHQRVETCLNDFIAELFATADAMKRHREESARQRRQWEDEARRRQEAAMREADHARAAKELHEIVDRWRLARDIRQYVGEVIAAAAERGQPVAPESKTGRSLSWASRYADSIDPIARARPPE